MLHEYEAKLTTKDDVGAEMIKYQAISMPHGSWDAAFERQASSGKL